VTRIHLEPFTAAHVPVWADLTLDPDVQRFTSVPEPPPPGYAQAWFDAYERGRLDGTREAFVVVEDGAVLGVGVAVAIDRPGRTVELGYTVAPQARGRGVATQALGALTAWAFTELDALRAELRIGTGNEASERVAARCGYVFEGILRSVPLKPGSWGDLAVWSRLATDPPVPPAISPER
jgi:RimJ/RimL family protein N-acetyltransferase